MRCISLASLLEISGWPKPGNVHRTRDFKETKFEHFLAGVASLQPSFRLFCGRIQEGTLSTFQDLSYIKLGEFFRDSAECMMNWQKGGNVLLGHILILGPLVASTILCQRSNLKNLTSFSQYLEKVIKTTTVEDTINLYKAIRICNPGGLGKIEKYDLNDPDVLEKLREDKIALLTIFERSQEYDLISHEYAHNFSIILNEGLPYFRKTFKETNNINISTVNTYLYLLSNHNDTLIIRKSGFDAARLVSKKAKEILKYEGIKSNKGLELTKDLDDFLQEREGRMNPGTIADLICGVIFMALVYGLRF